MTDEKSLAIAFGYNFSVNGKWACPLCSNRGSGMTRLHEHAERHLSFPGWLEMLRKSVEGNSKSSTVETFNRKFPRKAEATKESVDAQNNKLKNQFVEAAKEVVTQAVCEAIIDGPYPLNLPEQPSLHSLVDQILAIGWDAAKSGHSLPKAVELLISRRAITPLVYAFCKNTKKAIFEPHLRDAATRGVTLVSDRRSNINNDPLLVMGVEGASGFVPLGIYNAGKDKKDAEYLKNLSLRYLDDTDLGEGFGDFIFSNVMDGALASRNAMVALQRFHYLIFVQCQSHALALHVKNVLKKCFPDVLEKATTLITFIRGKCPVHTIIKNKSGKSVFRFVDTRFSTHVIACARLVELQYTLVNLYSDPQFKGWEADQKNADTKNEIEAVHKIISDNGFWQKMTFMLACLSPALNALRLMDQSRIRAKNVNSLWSALEKKLAATLTMEENFSSMDLQLKRMIISQFVADRSSAHNAVFDLAWALDPRNQRELFRLAFSSEKDDLGSWACFRKNCETVLKTLVRREIAIAYRKEQSSKRRKLETADAFSDDFDNSLIEERASALIKDVITEFYQYVSMTGDFSEAEIGVESSMFWVKYGRLLKFRALIILDIACTSSNVERLHNVYSVIHTSDSNRLDENRVDTLATATIARRIMREPVPPFARGVERFAEVSEKDWDAIIKWGLLSVAADCATQRTLSEPTVNVKLDATPSAPDYDVADDHLDDSITVTAEPDVGNTIPNNDDSLPVQTESRRVVRFSHAFREAGQALGLSSNFYC